MHLIQHVDNHVAIWLLERVLSERKGTSLKGFSILSESRYLVAAQWVLFRSLRTSKPSDASESRVRRSVYGPMCIAPLHPLLRPDGTLLCWSIPPHVPRGTFGRCTVNTPCSHLPEFLFGYLFLTHTHLSSLFFAGVPGDMIRPLRRSVLIDAANYSGTCSLGDELFHFAIFYFRHEAVSM